MDEKQDNSISEEKSDNNKSRNKYDYRISNELDEAFSTLSLVNSPDIDAFMKAIMFMKKKPAQNLRGELNHLIGKYLDEDKELRQKFIKNKYEEFDFSYIEDIYYKVLNAKIDVHRKEMKMNIIKILDTCETFVQFEKIMKNYADRAQELDNNDLSNIDAYSNFIASCCNHEASINYLADLHSSIHQIYKLWKLNNLGNCIIDTCYISVEHDLSGSTACVDLHFHTVFFNKTIFINVLVSELKEDMAAEIMAQFCFDTEDEDDEN